jgi:glycosyltransferase involved in cell wall biosynthesis
MANLNVIPNETRNETRNETTNQIIKVGFLNHVSSVWFNLYSSKLEQVSRVDDADYIIFESNGDPISTIMKIKATFPKNKLVFILSGDQNIHIDDECIWFTNAVRSSGLAKMQTQIFVTNPAIFKFYNSLSLSLSTNDTPIVKSSNRKTDIYFKGTIWTGMRTEMFEYFTRKPICKIIENNGYWSWRLNNVKKPTQEELELTAFETYHDMLDSKLVLCPKGNGNSSMRIVEALACGAIPILIDDFSAPFGVEWAEFGLVFNTSVEKWDSIYTKCLRLLTNPSRMEKMQKKGMDYFSNVIYGDKHGEIYNDINTVCYGFSHKILEKLEKLYLERKCKK